MNEQTTLLHSIPTDPLTGALSVPIYQTSTFVQESPGVHRGYDYARTANPTRHALERLLAVLERGTAAYAFSSGLAAIDAVLKLFRSGDRIVCVDDVYGGTFRQFERVYAQFGLRVDYVDTSDLGAVRTALETPAALVWLETPTNPTLKISDIGAIAQLAHDARALLVVDNTFATPCLQCPLDLGADIVVHSATKYLAGHSDLIAGAVVTKSEQLAERLKFVQNASGAILSPFDSWLTVRGIETVHLRVDRHCSAALLVARFLSEHPRVKRVFYPGLETHPNHELARVQQRGRFGGVVSFDLADVSIEQASAVASSTKLFKLAESLGGVKSLIAHPALMTHKTIPSEVRARSGVTDTLLRLSVGLEDPADLIADLRQAMVV